MELKTFSARTMQEALQLVRRELGPDASVLHTREVRSRKLFGLLPGPSHIEVTASRDVNVPSRLAGRGRRRASMTDMPAGGMLVAPAPDRAAPALPGADPVVRSVRLSAAGLAGISLDELLAAPLSPPRAEASDVPAEASTRRFHDQVQEQLSGLESLVEELRRTSRRSPRPAHSDPLFTAFTGLIEADVSEELARELLEHVRVQLTADELADADRVRESLVIQVEARIRTCGPIQVVAGQRRLVALVGPTGVGKTTTIAKLAANFRLRDKKKVGLVTVDTYRIAAVDQLRTYADIIDLPMEVVSTPREVQPALARLRDQELILMDTAGRSPHDAIRVQELKAMLAEAGADEVHLVLSSVAAAGQLRRTAEQFGEVGTTALILTKLDEATSLGNLLPLLSASGLPLSYVTDGQNVPDDIAPAQAAKLARRIFGGPS